MNTEQLCESPEAVSQLLGGGADLTGRIVEYCGHHWIVSGKNYLGDWDVVRFRDRDDGSLIKVESSIAPEILPLDHPHHAQLIQPPNIA